MKKIIIIAVLAATTLLFTANAYYGGRCTGSKGCTACKNCKYCKYCAKQGGICGVCK